MTEIWEDLTNTGYIQHDISTCYTLSILQYSLSLKIAGMFTFAQFVEQSQICQLLPRLNLTHDPIRAQILGKERLSSLFESCNKPSLKTDLLVRLDKLELSLFHVT